MVATAQDFSAAPAAIGPYQVIDKLGEGGMGVVYRARHARSGELVALKTVPAPDIAVLPSLRREIHALRRVRHPGVVRIVDEGVHDGLPWYAMELLEGRTLRVQQSEWWRDTRDTVASGATRLQSPRSEPSRRQFADTVPPPPSQPPATRSEAAGGHLREALGMVRRMCGALAFLHGEGIVHRDLKPENVFVRPDGTPVLMDFGLVSGFGGAAGRDSLQVGGALEGSFGYMAPEQIYGDLVDARADLYALGCILYEAVAGKLPFGAGAGTLAQHILEAAPPLSAHVDGVPPALDELVARLLAKRSRDRIGYAADVAAALGAIAPPAKPGARGTVPVPAPPPRPYLYRPEFAGRSALVADFEARLDLARNGEGGCVLIAGESGAGKTRLASEVATAANRRAFRVAVGECTPIQVDAAQGEREGMHGAPLHPFRLLLQSIADHCLVEGEAETERLLGPRGPVLALYEPSLSQLPGQRAYPEPAQLPAQAARDRTIAQFTETLAALAEREPLLLIIDDLQWADDLTLGVVASLASGALARSRTLLIGAYRSEEITPALRGLAASEGVAHFRLARLDESTVASMVGNMLSLASPPESFVAFLTRQSEGNPFFVAEYLRTAVGEGLLRRNESGHWVVGEMGSAAAASLSRALPLPGTLRDLVGRRLSGLAAGERALVEVAAVLGREFEAEVLASAASMADAAQLEALEGLLAAGVIEDAGSGQLRFAHDKLREAAYGAAAPARRRALHAAAACAVLASPAARATPERLYSTLAHHYATAGDDARATEYLELAGAHAARTGANAEAAALYRRAIEIDARLGAASHVDATRRAGWQRRLGEALFGLGDVPGCKVQMVASLESLGAPTPASRGAWGRALLGGIARQGAHLISRGRAAASAGRTAPARESLLAAALASGRLAECLYWEQDVLAMVASSLHSVNLAERAGRGAEVKRNYAQLGYLVGLARIHPLARGYFRLARGEGRPEGEDPGGVAFGLCLESMYELGFARWSLARASASRAVDILRAIGDKQELEIALTLRAQPDFYTGRFEATLPAFEAIRESARARSNVQHDAWGAFAAARSLVPLGRLDEAESLLLESLRLLGGLADRPSEILCHGLLAQAYRLRGDTARARTAADAVTALAKGAQPTVYSEGHGYEGAADAYLDAWAQAGGATEAKQARAACALLSGFARVFPLGAPSALRCEGRAHWIAGKRERALAAWAKSARAANALGMPFERAAARDEYGRAVGGEAGAKASREAADAFRALGCASLAARAEAGERGR